jgi:hypothetical protein
MKGARAPACAACLWQTDGRQVSPAVRRVLAAKVPSRWMTLAFGRSAPGGRRRDAGGCARDGRAPHFQTATRRSATHHPSSRRESGERGRPRPPSSAPAWAAEADRSRRRLRSGWLPDLWTGRGVPTARAPSAAPETGAVPISGYDPASAIQPSAWHDGESRCAGRAAVLASAH